MKSALFCLLGVVLGAGGTVAIVMTLVIPKFNKAIDQDNRTMAQQSNSIQEANSYVREIQAQLRQCH